MSGNRTFPAGQNFGNSLLSKNGSYGSYYPDSQGGKPYWKSREEELACEAQKRSEAAEGGVGSAGDESMVTDEETKSGAKDSTTTKDVVPGMAEPEATRAEAKTADTGLSTDANDPADTTDTGKSSQSFG